MNIGKVDYGRQNNILKGIKRNDENDSIFNDKDTVTISSPSKDEPLDITLHINGKVIEKKIMGHKTDNEIILNIKHTNDVHGNMPSVANLIKPDDFWVDAGDAWQDHTFSSVLFGGREEVDLMNRRDCDIATTGNHFYDNEGVKGAKQLITESDFPYISANTKGMSPYIIADVEGVKIAFIGVRTEQKRFQKVDPSLVKDLDITDPVEAVKKSVEEVKSKGVDNIVVLSHLGLDTSTEYHHDTVSDKDLAGKVSGIDLIIGGHTHTPTFDKVEVNHTRIVHAGIIGHDDVTTAPLYLGDLTLTVDKSSKKIVNIDHKLVPVDRENPVDGDIKEIKDDYIREKNNVLGEKLNNSKIDFTHEIKTPVDSSLGNLITDAMRKETGADIAIIDSKFFAQRGKNTGSNILPKGDITMRDLVNTAPWMGKDTEARVETWDVKGHDIKKLLEDGVNKLLGEKKNEGLYQVSGIEMSYNPTNPEGSRVTEITVGGQPLDSDRSYRFTTTYSTGNWNQIFAERNENEVKDGPPVRLLVADYIKNTGPLEAIDKERIKQV